MAAIQQIVTAAGGPTQRILDYGCGDLYTGRMLLDRLNAESLVGVDTGLTPELCVRYREGDPRIELHAHTAPLQGRCFELVLLCDVIEHVADDREVIAAVRDYLTPNGRIVVTVPAFQALFSERDRALKHFRRYTLAGLQERLKAAGLVPLAGGYLFGSLLLIRAVQKLWEWLRGGAGSGEHGIGAWRGGRALTALIVLHFKLEHAVLFALARLGVKLPGLTAWAICKRS